VTIEADPTAVLFLPTSYGISPFVHDLPIVTQPVSHTLLLD
jgi:hypothetical protein